MVSLLMDQGANLGYQNEHGNTALHEAALNGHHSVVKKIVSGKDKKVINQVNTAGETPLIIAAKYGNEKVVDRLILAGADRTWKAVNGETAYDCAKTSTRIQYCCHMFPTYDIEESNGFVTVSYRDVERNDSGTLISSCTRTIETYKSEE
jgi:hypothetical protein